MYVREGMSPEPLREIAMPYFSINTRGPGFTREFATLDAALDWVQPYLPLKRGYTVRRQYRGDAGWVQVLNTKGAVVNGAVAYPATPADIAHAVRS